MIQIKIICVHLMCDKLHVDHISLCLERQKANYPSINYIMKMDVCQGC